MIHTSVDGTHDIEPMKNERIYHLASADPSGSSFLPDEGSRMHEVGIPYYRGNPLDLSFPLRSLALRLVSWVEAVQDPPASAFPRIGEGTLVSPDGLAFPDIPGVSVPKVVHEAYRADYGPRWWSEGIVDRQPPELGEPFPAMVSQVDGFGNEVGGVRGWEIRAPLGSYAPWNLRLGREGGEDELTDVLGTFIPLSPTEEERAALGDPRPSVQALYSGKDRYLERVRAAIRELVREGFLLPDDAGAAVEEAELRWDWLVTRRDK